MNNLCPRCFRQTLSGDDCTNCGYSRSLAKRDVFALPEFTMLHDRYLIGEVLGAGGFGITYLAFDNRTRERKAIKEYFFRSVAIRNEGSLSVCAVSPKKEVVYQSVMRRFKDEARILLSLGGIRSVVRVDECFNENNTSYMVMEYVDGVPLSKICKSSAGTVDFDKANAQFVAIALTLDEIHMRDLLHRDVSPDNIMILPNGSIKLIDFGAARYVANEENHSLTVVVKAGFAPIEQYSSKGVQGPWTDIYGLSCSMYWYLTGQKVPDAPSRRDGKDVEPIYKLRPDVPRGFSDAIEKGMAFDYRDRFQTISEMIGAVDDATGLMPTQSIPAEEKTTTSLFSRWKKSFEERDRKKPPLIFAQIVGGPFDGFLFQFPDNGNLVMGRSEQYCNAVLNVSTISRLHCTIHYDSVSKTFTLTDQSSTGTFVSNGRKLKNGESTQITLDDMFWLSSPEYMVRILMVDQ